MNYTTTIIATFKRHGSVIAKERSRIVQFFPIVFVRATPRRGLFRVDSTGYRAPNQVNISVQYTLYRANRRFNGSTEIQK